MITLNDIPDPSTFRKLFIERMYQADNLLYPLNSYIAYNILSKNFLALKTFCSNNPSSSITVAKWQELNSTVPISSIDSVNAYIDSVSSFQVSYVFIGSKSSFKNLFYDFMPTAFDAMFSYFTENNHIKQIGSGKGSAILFKPSIFDSNFEDYTPPVIVDHNFILTEVLSNIKNLNSDNEYLVSIINDKDVLISHLNKIISDLKQENFITSQMTWR